MLHTIGDFHDILWRNSTCRCQNLTRNQSILNSISHGALARHDLGYRCRSVTDISLFLSPCPALDRCPAIKHICFLSSPHLEKIINKRLKRYISLFAEIKKTVDIVTVIFLIFPVFVMHRSNMRFFRGSVNFHDSLFEEFLANFHRKSSFCWNSTCWCQNSTTNRTTLNSVSRDALARHGFGYCYWYFSSSPCPALDRCPAVKYVCFLSCLRLKQIIK